jgi:hypothetical protein
MLRQTRFVGVFVAGLEVKQFFDLRANTIGAATGVNTGLTESFFRECASLRTAIVVLYTRCSPARELQTRVKVRGSAKEKHANV